jgi:branched-subunit amino acid transport protein AzlD
MILLWGISPAIAGVLVVLAVSAFDHGHGLLGCVLLIAAAVVAVLRWIWR